MQNLKQRTSRHDKRERYVYYPRTSGRMAKVEIHHRDGGMNYFSGGTEKRGIEVSVSVVEIGASGNSGCMVESYSPMADCNARFLVTETARYNKGKLERIAAAMDADMPKLAETWEQDTGAGKRMLVEIAERAAKAA